MKEKESQETAVLIYLLEGKTINQEQAIRLFGCYRLSDRIYTLRKLSV